MMAEKYVGLKGRPYSRSKMQAWWSFVGNYSYKTVKTFIVLSVAAACNYTV